MTAPTLQPVIVGAGPAGIRAAQTLVAHGVRPVVIDEAARGGGQIYRRPPAHFARSAQTLYGTEASRATALHSTFDGLRAHMDYQPDSLVWNAQGGMLDVLHGPTQTTRTVPYGQLIVASGATDRVLPVPGWTLPGVYTLGGAQVALKFQGCTIGRNVVLMGTGPLLYLVAYQYAKAGTKVAAVLDTARFADQLAALPGMLKQPTVLGKGLYYVAWLRAHGVVVHRRATCACGRRHPGERRGVERRGRRAHRALRRRGLWLRPAVRNPAGRPAGLPLCLGAHAPRPPARARQRWAHQRGRCVPGGRWRGHPGCRCGRVGGRARRAGAAG